MLFRSRRAEGLLPAFLDAAGELVQLGADAITTNCGFLSLFQAELAARVKVPVATSSLMQVPIAVSALTSEALESRGLKSIQEISEYTPGLFSQVQGNGRVDRASRRLTFRGLSVNVGATFINGAPYSGTGAPDPTDVERVEVLKGPQSVYFGRSTFSGAVNYVTKEPSTEKFSGKVTGEIYSYNSIDASANVTGPIVSDKLGFRANVRRFHTDGQYKNGGTAHPGGKLGEQDTTSFSVALLATPTDKLKIHAFYAFTKDEDGTPVEASIKPAGLSALFNCQLGGTGGPWYCGELPKLDAIDKRNISVYDVMDPLMMRELIENVRGYLSYSHNSRDHWNRLGSDNRDHVDAKIVWDLDEIGRAHV